MTDHEYRKGVRSVSTFLQPSQTHKAVASSECSALDDYTPPPKYRRWEFALTLETWALPLCITRFHCGAWTMQFLCFELHTSIAHRWPNGESSNPARTEKD